MSCGCKKRQPNVIVYISDIDVERSKANLALQHVMRYTESQANIAIDTFYSVGRFKLYEGAVDSASELVDRLAKRRVLCEIKHHI